MILFFILIGGHHHGRCYFQRHPRPHHPRGDDIVDIVVNSVYASEKEDNYTLKDRDVIAVTESVVARAQGNYVTVDQVAQDIRNKFPTKKLGLVFPILSRNRFSMCLKGIAGPWTRWSSCLATPTTRWATP